jgi:hypothetical protein
LNNIFSKNYYFILDLKWGLGIGDWGLGIGDWAQSPIPNPQSPIPISNQFRIILQLLFIYILS